MAHDGDVQIRQSALYSLYLYGFERQRLKYTFTLFRSHFDIIIR